MDERVHRALDDATTAGALPSRVAAELDETRALLDAVLRTIPAPPLPDLGSAVLRRVAAHESVTLPRAATVGAQRRGVAEWLWSPHPVSVSVRPAYAIAAALLLAAVISGPVINDRRGRENPSIATVAKMEVLVHFTLDAPQATAVSLAGDFSNWNPAHALQRSANGMWTVVVPLTPGVHDYSFVIDGTRWVPDPVATPISDGFGGTNSRIAVIGPDKRT